MPEHDEFIKYAKEHNLAVMTTEMYEEAISALEKDFTTSMEQALLLKVIDKFLPTECEDAISRQAVIEKLNERDMQELYLPIHFKEHIIDELPSVTPSNKVIEDIRAEIELLHYHPKLDFIRNDEVVEMAIEIIDKHIGQI